MLVNHPIRKILLVGIAAQVLKWQHGDGRLVREWRDRSQPITQRAMRSRNGVGADRLGNVLEVLLATILEASVQLALDFVVDLVGNQDTARIGGPLLSVKSRRSPRTRQIVRVGTARVSVPTLADQVPSNLSETFSLAR